MPIPSAKTDSHNHHDQNQSMKIISQISIYIAAFGLLLAPFAFQSCSTVPTGNENIDRRNRVANALLASAEKAIGSIAANTLKTIVSEQMNGQKIDLASAAAQGAWTAAGSIVSSDDIKNVIDAWTGNKLPVVASAAANAFAAAADAGATPQAATNAIAATISSAALSAK